MRRRALLRAMTAGLCAGPGLLRAQPAVRVWRIGMLESIPAAENAANLDAFRRGLAAAGYVEGRNLAIDYRSSDGRAERFPALADDLVRRRVDLIVARGTPATRAAREATSKVPIVMATMGDPGTIVASLAQPGGNVTGVTTFSTELSARRLALLKELAPSTSHVALLHNLGNPAAAVEWQETQAAARALGIRADLLDARSDADVARAFDTAAHEHVDALVVGFDGLTQMHRRAIVDFAAKARLPAAYPAREFVAAGGLLAYSVNYPDLYFRFASYVDRILRGAKPGDLPVERPTRFELTINVRTAAALGLEVSPSLRLQADELVG